MVANREYWPNWKTLQTTIDVLCLKFSLYAIGIIDSVQLQSRKKCPKPSKPAFTLHFLISASCLHLVAMACDLQLAFWKSVSARIWLQAACGYDTIAMYTLSYSESILCQAKKIERLICYSHISSCWYLSMNIKLVFKMNTLNVTHIIFLNLAIVVFGIIYKCQLILFTMEI